MSNFKWGQDFDRSYQENKKKFWKEVRRVRKGGSRTKETVKDVNGRLLRGNEARKRWAEYFEELLDVQEDRESCSGSRGCSGASNSIYIPWPFLPVWGVADNTKEQRKQWRF